MPPAATHRTRMAAVFFVASVLSMLLVFPAAGSADTLVSFSASGSSNGTISGSTVSGVTFNTIAEGATVTSVNSFIEAYSSGVLTFAVSGGGNLGGAFSNVSGTFITIDESAPTFGGMTVSLLTTVTSLNVSPALLSDLALSGFILDPVQSTVSVTQMSGSVISTNAVLAFQSVATPEASTGSMLGVGLLVAGWLGLRRRKIGLNRETVA
jgi:MYXO-CTERM domain-containing protein